MPRAQANADALYDAAARGERIVFLEPSCLSAVREDAPALLRGEAQRKARVVADACVLFEDYLEQDWQAGRIALELKTGSSDACCCTATVIRRRWACCRQRARCSRASRRAPSSISTRAAAGWPGRSATRREHYEVSRQIGERQAAAGRAGAWRRRGARRAGTSCRQQVAHFTGVKALHPAELLRSLLTSNQSHATDR